MIRVLVLQYYRLLRSLPKTHPSMRRWRTRCRHCGLFFLTYFRNAWRTDLYCPFGCRVAQRRAASNKRSAAYYQSKEGKIKKQALNRRRSLISPPVPPPVPPPLSPPLSPPQKPMPWSPEIVEHVRAVVSVIEGRPFTRLEILELLARILRQHRNARRRRRDQVVAWLNEFPP